MSSKLTRGLQSTIDNTPIEDGKIRFANDTGRMYIDSANNRIQVTDIIYGLTYAEIIGLENPLPKLYLTSDTHQIMSYDFALDEWIIYDNGCSPDVVIVDEYFNDEGDLVLIYGNGDEKEIDITSSAKVSALINRITTLEEKMADYESAISLVKSE